MFLEALQESPALDYLKARHKVLLPRFSTCFTFVPFVGGLWRAHFGEAEDQATFTNSSSSVEPPCGCPLLSRTAKWYDYTILYIIGRTWALSSPRAAFKLKIVFFKFKIILYWVFAENARVVPVTKSFKWQMAMLHFCFDKFWQDSWCRMDSLKCGTKFCNGMPLTHAFVGVVQLPLFP